MKPGISADRFGGLPDQFHAVVIFWIVACSDNNATIHIEVRGSEVNLLCPTLANIKNVYAAIPESINHCLTNGWARKPDIVANDHLLRCQKHGVSPANTVGNIFVQFIRNATTNIVSFKTGNYRQGLYLSLCVKQMPQRAI